ncbi:hypothetical protein [Amycolatopsis minnesotensis]|uniref:Copper(I)-binding protein n=1 Tax=Amycolatopsis minnesotensis TaxID=337894 RepID=A0ABN2Q1R7_9PSEU
MRLQKRRVLGATVLGFGAVMAIAGCGAGQITQTNTQQAAVNGAYAQAGGLSIRDAAVVNREQCEQAYPQGSSAPLSLRVINQGPKDDVLEAVTSDLSAGGVVGGSKTIVASHTLVLGPAQAAGDEQAASPGSSSAPSSPGGKQSGAPSASSEPSAAEPTPAKVGEGTVTLEGLKTAIWPGQTVKVTFTFRDAGAVTVEVPMAAPKHALKCGVETKQEQPAHE